ncbi:MAG: ABC transporter ATP-binding protein [Desulfatibacillaceae bacterium]|nr:ABC transporter ATP-binding protein [Desulfatibacillaceae bacterium]
MQKLMENLLEITNLKVVFDMEGQSLVAVDGVSFSIGNNEVVGLVGESGCGKSVAAMSILRLVPEPPGRIVSGKAVFEGRDLLGLNHAALRSIRGAQISMIFQDPMTALSPIIKIGPQLAETLTIHGQADKKQALEQAVLWLKKVGIPEPERIARAYPFELSGGMQQRVMIAMALILNPKLVIADEPTTALDVTVAAQIFDLLNEMRSRATSVLLITHDLGVIWEMCDRVMVMYAGKIVEQASKEELFAAPAHPYTIGLLQSMPRLADRKAKLYSIKGQVPSPLNYPPGCRFNDRCPHAFERCREEQPPLKSLGKDRKAACFIAERLLGNG